MTRSHGSIPAGLVSAVRVAGSQEVGEGTWLVCALLGFMEAVGSRVGPHGIWSFHPPGLEFFSFLTAVEWVMVVV